MLQVTYFNQILRETCVLADGLDAEAAAKVLATFGDERDPFCYMGPEVKIEPMPESPAA